MNIQDTWVPFCRHIVIIKPTFNQEHNTSARNDDPIWRDWGDRWSCCGSDAFYRRWMSTSIFGGRWSNVGGYEPWVLYFDRCFVHLFDWRGFFVTWPGNCLSNRFDDGGYINISMMPASPHVAWNDWWSFSLAIPSTVSCQKNVLCTGMSSLKKKLFLPRLCKKSTRRGLRNVGAVSDVFGWLENRYRICCVSFYTDSAS